MPNGRIIDFRALFLCIGNTLLNLHSEIVTQATVDLDGCCHTLRKKFFYCVCNYNVEQFVDSNAYGVPSQLALFKEFTDNYRYDGYNYPLQGYDSPIFFISLIVFKWHVRRHSPFLKSVPIGGFVPLGLHCHNDLHKPTSSPYLEGAINQHYHSLAL